MPDRRGFLKSLIGAGLVAAADPEKLLWVPGEKTIFVPPPPLELIMVTTRIFREFDFAQNRFVSRMDVLYGWSGVSDKQLGIFMEAAACIGDNVSESVDKMIVEP